MLYSFAAPFAAVIMPTNKGLDLITFEYTWVCEKMCSNRSVPDIFFFLQSDPRNEGATFSFFWRSNWTHTHLVQGSPLKAHIAFCARTRVKVWT